MSKKSYKNLSKEDIEYLVHIYYEDNMSHREKMDTLTSKFGGVSERTIRRWWKEGLNLSESFSHLPYQLQKAKERTIDNDTDILLVTAAQNKTGVNTNFLKNLEAYRDFLTSKGKKAQIVIAPSKYRNPTSATEFNLKDKSEQWWRDELQPYLHYGKIQFGDTLISSDSRVRPTAKNPLTGYEVLAKDNHLIIPHSRIHFQTLPRFKNKPLRTMSTTGFITYKNYSDSKVGDIAFENHSAGFVTIEKRADGTCFIPRNVKVNTQGEFTDLIFDVKFEKVNIIDSSKGIVLGDLHSANIKNEVFNETTRLLDYFKPKKLVAHDIMDGTSVNPHERKDFFIQRRNIVEGKDAIEDEIEHTFDIIDILRKKVPEIHVIISNHDLFLDRHINDMNWRSDLRNSPAYLKYAYIYQTVDLRKYGSIYGYLLKERFGDDVNYVNYEESLDIGGYECGDHTDHGVNGARGSVNTFSKLNMKLIGAHGHSPIIKDGFSRVGVTCDKDQYYTRKGLSSWAYAHNIIHNNNKNQMLVFTDDYRLTDLF